MIQNLALKGLLCVIGSFMISLAVGLMYLWGIITVYATSYFRITMKDSSLTQQITDIVFPLTLLGQAISMPFAARFVRKTSSRMNCIIAGVAMACCMYLASYCVTFKSFALIYGLFNGIIIGIIYIIPIAHCYQFFPNKKSSISVIIVAASGIGTLLFAYIGFNVMNFENVSASSNADGFYGTNIANHFPEYLKILSLIVFILVSGGGVLLFQYPTNIQVLVEVKKKKQKKQQNLASLMDLQFTLQKQQSQQQQKNPFGNMNYEMAFISKGYDQGKMYGQKNDRQFWPSLNESESQKYVPPNQYDETNDNSKNKDNQNVEFVNECPRTRDGPKQTIFWKIFIIIVCGNFSIILGTNFGLMMSNNYKSFAKMIITNEQFLITIGALAAVACGFSRYFWGYMIEKVGFKGIYSLMCIVNAFLAFTVYYIKSWEPVYCLYVVLAYISYGGHLGMFPAIASQVFGVRYGPQIYGILFFAFPVSNFIQYTFINIISTTFGYWFVFMISGGMSVLALLMSNRVQYKYDWSQKIRQNNQRKRLQAR